MTAYLITRPEHDDTTHYLSNWSKETIISAQKRGIKALDLHREKANKLEVEGIIKHMSPKLIVFNGHGDNNIVTGHKNEPIIIADKNHSSLRSSIAYAISCKSASALGLKAVDAGAISYIGYTDDFIFFYEPNKITMPLQDETAKLFLEHARLFINSLIKGNSVSESYKKAQDLLKNNILKLSGNNKDANLIRFLWWDLKHFVSHGNQDAKL